MAGFNNKNAGKTKKQSGLNLKSLLDMFGKMDFKPPCHCAECRLQYRYTSSGNFPQYAYIGWLEAEEASDTVKTYYCSIVRDCNYLRRTAESHGSLMLQQWCRGSKQRRAILHKAVPDMYGTHNPLMEIVHSLDGVEGSLMKQRSYKSAYMMPYLNVDDLVEDPHRLIGLLHHRTHNTFASWVPFDNWILQISWDQAAFTEKSAEGCVLMHHANYATLTDFDQDAVHRGEAYTTPRALLILETQQRLMEILRKVVAVMLADADTAPLLERIPMSQSISTVPTFKPCQEWVDFLDSRELHCGQPWQSFATICVERPFSGAPECDIDVLVEIAEGRASEAQDELWLLQSDLEYFYDRAKYHEARWFDKIPGLDAMKHFTAKEKRDNIGYIVTIDALMRARDWQWILEECEKVKTEEMRHEAEIIETKATFGRALPPGYEDALGSLYKLIHKAWNDRKTSLRRDITKFPEFQNIYKVTGIADSVIGKLTIHDFAGKPAKLFSNDRIAWCLFELCREDINMVSRFDPITVLQHLDECMRNSSPKEAKRIGPEIARSISDLAAISQMSSLLNLHRPRFRKPKFDDLSARSPAWEVHIRCMKDPCFISTSQMNLGSALNPLKIFQMPGGRKDKKWLKQWDAAHQALADLWKKARAGYQMMMDNKSVPQEFIDPQLDMMKQCESIENVARLATEREDFLACIQTARQRAVARKTVPTSTENDLSAAQVDLQMKYRYEPPVEKIKTRPPQTSITPDDSSVDKITPEVHQIPQNLYEFKENSAAAKVIRHLFPGSGDGRHKGVGCVDWLDFVTTMKDLGFGAEHGGGSAFIFKGTINLPQGMSNQQKRSIVIHRPHPDTEMGPGMLRGIAKRLSRRFGWEQSHFLIS